MFPDKREYINLINLFMRKGQYFNISRPTRTLMSYIAHESSLTILYLLYVCTYVFNSFSRKLQHVSNSKYLIIMGTLHLITARNYERDFTSSQY